MPSLSDCSLSHCFHWATALWSNTFIERLSSGKMPALSGPLTQMPSVCRRRLINACNFKRLSSGLNAFNYVKLMLACLIPALNDCILAQCLHLSTVQWHDACIERLFSCMMPAFSDSLTAWWLRWTTVHWPIAFLERRSIFFLPVLPNGHVAQDLSRMSRGQMPV